MILHSFRGCLMQDQVSPSISDACVEWMDSFRWHVPSLDTGHFTPPPQIFTWHVSVGGGPSKETRIHTFTMIDFFFSIQTYTPGFLLICGMKTDVDAVWAEAVSSQIIFLLWAFSTTICTKKYKDVKNDHCECYKSSGIACTPRRSMTSHYEVKLISL